MVRAFRFRVGSAHQISFKFHITMRAAYGWLKLPPVLTCLLKLAIQPMYFSVPGNSEATEYGTLFTGYLENPTDPLLGPWRGQG